MVLLSMVLSFMLSPFLRKKKKEIVVVEICTLKTKSNNKFRLQQAIQCYQVHNRLTVSQNSVHDIQKQESLHY